MINFIGKIDGVSLYEDDTLSDNFEVIKGRTQGVEGYTFIVAHPNTAQLMFNKHRIQKIEKIKDRIQCQKQ